MTTYPDTIVHFKTLEAQLSDLAASVENIADAIENNDNTGAFIVGEIRFLPQRPTALPSGWYFCNGDKYATSSAQGVVLNGLPTTFKSDWSIVVASSQINLPNLFDTAGDGYFVRAAGGSARQVGVAAKQTDAIMNIQGGLKTRIIFADKIFSYNTSFVSNSLSALTYDISDSNNTVFRLTNTVPTVSSNETYLNFDASRSVTTASEVRPKNVGMTPAIYLGV